MVGMEPMELLIVSIVGLFTTSTGNPAHDSPLSVPRLHRTGLS